MTVGRTMVALAGLTLGALAQTAAAGDDGWSGQITPYVWAAGIAGDLRPFSGAPTISFDKSFSEILEDSDGAFFLSGFARKGRFVVLGDFSYSASSKEGLIPPGFPASGELKQSSLTLAAGYRAVSEGDIVVDVLAGFRAWSVSASVDVLGGAIQKSPDKEFVDPILALRANVSLSPSWSAILFVDAGGLGVGSETTYQLLATANYQISDHIYLSAGYRHLDVDYRDGGTRVDAIMSGPILGVTWRF